MNDLQALSYITTVAGGLLLWLLEGVVPFFSGRAARGKHAAKNLSIAGINLLILLPAGPIMAVVLEKSKAVWPGVGLLKLPFILETILIILLVDLWMYACGGSTPSITAILRWTSRQPGGFIMLK